MTDIFSELGDFFLTAMLAYGSPALALALLLAALGVPLPGTMFVMAAGAFVQQGVMDTWSTAGLALLGAVMGDSLSYSIGRFGSSLLPERLVHSDTWQRAQQQFDRRGGAAIVLTRFLLTPLALPTNLIAGSSRYPFQRFLLFDISGEIIWVALFGSLGYIFADSWEALGSLVGNLAGVLVGVLALAGGGYLVYRLWRRPAARAEDAPISPQPEAAPLVQEQAPGQE
jgi:membrane protein DedA with SNARE-associated domain